MDPNLLGSICNQLSWPQLVQVLVDRQLATVIESYDRYRHTYLEVRVYDPKLREVLHKHWPQHQLDTHTWRL